MTEAEERRRVREDAVTKYRIARRGFDLLVENLGKISNLSGSKELTDAAKMIVMGNVGATTNLRLMNSLPSPEREMAVNSFLFGRVYGYQEALSELILAKRIVSDFIDEVEEENVKREAEH